jgi:formate hydrogenlyase subunit 3/multisubunit Na+/H+ antiporter MnhD subunit
MNQFILNVMIVYTIASIIYLLSLFLLKSNKITDILNEEQMEEYSKIRKQKIMVFIIGIVIGLCFIILFDNFFNKEAISKATISVKNIVEDVSDISVI